MIEITVGQVSGLVALGTFIMQIWIPTAIVLGLVAILREQDNAATWSVTGKALQSSWWPFILRHETVTNEGLSRRLSFITYLLPVSLTLIAITGVVTPLGLYDSLVVGGEQSIPFRYTKDTSPFGYGTPPRSDLPFNRRCGAWNPVVCPGSNTTVIENRRTGTYYLPFGYDINVPDDLYEIFLSGTGSRGSTISNFFDIQWRHYFIQQRSDFNNGSQYLVGMYRQLESMILNNSTELVEGLIVDTRGTRIGFRNHTLPTESKYGATWSEDLLFVEPETQCVSNNISIDFTIAESSVYESDFSHTTPQASDIAVVDRGGFAELVQDYPDGYWVDTQDDPTLRERAYKAAWVTNAGSMAYLNVTNTAPRPFSYLNSHVGKQFPLYEVADLGQFQGMRTWSTLDFITNSSLAIRGDNATVYPNPFDINSTYFSEADVLCRGAGSGDRANISNIAVSCGMIFSAARRTDNTETAIFEQGTRWTIPLYTCASAVKASIKRVKLETRGPGLQNASVLDISETVYDSASPPPLWGVENLDLNLSDANSIWDLVSPSYENRRNISTIRKPHLYLPGYTGGGSSFLSAENLPGTSFHTVSLSRAYEIGSGVTDDMIDYSGKTNVALYTRLQGLSRTSDTAAHIINLLFTDITANLIVGTRSRLGSPADTDYIRTEDNAVDVVAVPLVKRVKFHLIYGIPAYTTLGLLIIVTATVLVLALLGKATFQRLRYFLARSSPGRILATSLHPDRSTLNMKSSEWLRSAGMIDIDLSGSHPIGADATGVCRINHDAMSVDPKNISPNEEGSQSA
ncbi:hypothetical protein BDV12DRAFT_35888 [Aspergillus spectabilis]